MLAVVTVPHGRVTTLAGEAPLSRELSHPGLLRSHVSVGHWWQNTRLSPPFEFSSYSCSFVSQPNRGLLWRLRRHETRVCEAILVFRSSYVLAWVRSSTHPYARVHYPVSHRTGLSLPSPKVATYGDIAFRRPGC